MMMKSVLLLGLLALSSASFLAIVNSTEYLNETILDPELGERIPEINANDSLLIDDGFLIPPAELEGKHGQRQSFKSGNLEWQTWRGSLPNGAVSIHNRYTRRYDYICKYKCEAGFYNPGMGPYCHYPFKRRAYRSAPFEILVNRNNFEFLEWKPSSFGRMPLNSVGTCSGGDIYVGMNKFGLGKVEPKRKAFFLPWKRKAYWYKRRYSVLTVQRDVIHERISDFKYKTGSSKIFHYPPETMRISVATNYACSEVVKTATLSKTSGEERSWETSIAVTAGVSRSIKSPIPFIFKGEITFTSEVTMETSISGSISEDIEHSVSVELTVPPNQYCRTRMVGYKYKADIPYTARLTRTYRNGQTRWSIVTGTYRGITMGEVWAVVDRCMPVPHPSPCR